MIEKFELYKYSDYAASDYAWSTVFVIVNDSWNNYI